MAELTETEIKVLSQLEKDSYKEVSDVHEAEEVKERIGAAQTRNILQDYSSKGEDKPVERRGKNPMSFKLTPKGEKLLKRENNSPTKQKYGEELEYQTMVEEFRELIENYQQKQESYIQEMNQSGKEPNITKIDKNLAAKAYTPNNVTLPISYKVIDFFNFELADELQEDFDLVLEALQEALEDHSISQESLGELHIRVADLPEEETETITELRARHIGKLVKIQGQLDSVTKTKPEISSAIFECSQCGDRYEKEQDSTELKSPYKCDCGSRKFETIEKKFIDSRVLRIKTSTSTDGNEGINAKLEGSAVDIFDNLYSRIGRNIEVSGYLQEFSTDKGNKKYDFYLEVNNLEFIDDDWSVEPLKDERMQELEQLREGQNWREWRTKILESFAPHIQHRIPLKTSVILWLFGRNDVDNPAGEIEDNLNVFIIGEPGLGKTQVIKWAAKHLPKTARGSGEGSTGVGLTAAIEKDDFKDEMRAKAKLIPKMHNGYVAVDEFDELSEQDYSNLLSILSDQEFDINKAGIDETIPADVGILASANPEFDHLDPYKPKTEQIPIPQDTVLNRFHFFLFAESGFDDDEMNREVNESVLKQGEPKEKLADEGELSEPPFSAEEVVDIIRYGRQFEPFAPDSIRRKIEEFFQKHKANFRESNVVLNKRQLRGVKKVARAFARLDFNDEVKERHLKATKDFYDIVGERAVPDEYNEGEGLENYLGKRTQSSQTHRKSKQEKIRKVIENLGGGEEPVKRSEVIKALSSDLREDYIHKLLDSMESDGEAFQPEPNKIQLSNR
jgi:replicative DNA helicase Mcm